MSPEPSQPSRSRLLGFIVAGVLVLIGLMTASPFLAVFDPGVLASSYGVTDPSPAELALLQHRGVLQLIVGVVLVWAAFAPAVRIPAAVATIVSKSLAVFLFVSTPGSIEGELGRNLVFDVVCSVLLLGVIADTLVHRRTRPRSPEEHLTPAAGAAGSADPRQAGA